MRILLSVVSDFTRMWQLLDKRELEVFTGCVAGWLVGLGEWGNLKIALVANTLWDLSAHWLSLFTLLQDQYVFLNQCVLDIIRSQKDSKVDLIYQNTTAMTIYENLAPVTAFGKTNGYIA